MNIKILIVTNEINEYIKIERILKPIAKKIQRAKFGSEALYTMSLTVYDLVIVYGDGNAFLSENSFIGKIREYVQYIPSLIVLLNEEDSKYIRIISNMKEVDYCFSLDLKHGIVVELFQDSVLTAIKLNDKRKSQKIDSFYTLNKHLIFPRFPGIGLAISTGGPKTINDVFEKIPTNFAPPIFIVQHGPDWITAEYASKCKERYGLNAVVAKDKQIIKENTIYIAPDKLNMVIDKNIFAIRLLDSEKECFVKPSADPLFRSMARAFGQFSIGIVMTGMGNDGSKGCLHIEAVGGSVLVEDPDTAIASSMPKELIAIVKKHTVYNSKDIGTAMVELANNLTKKLSHKGKK